MHTLPPIAYLDNIPDRDGRRPFETTTAPVIAVKRHESGYHPIHTKSNADALNAAEGVSNAQREAMLAGSLFGWHCRAADPNNYDAAGNLRR